MSDHSFSAAPKRFQVRVLRQDGPGQSSYWERHELEYEPEMNVTSVLQRLAAQAQSVDGEAVCPVAYESNCLEEVCGSCTMVINGRARQACSALVDKLLADHPGEIELRPMTKFPVIRDLVVDRQRMFNALKRVQAWIPVDGYYQLGPGPRQSTAQQEDAYPLSECMTCGCCVDACPQFGKVELARQPDETATDYAQRQAAVHAREFIGPHAISQAVLFNTHPTGKLNATDRLEALMAEGGLEPCGNAQNCVAVCPKRIPLTTSIARAGRATTLYAIKKLFGG
jgi:succinate dehydrogenase / fumarate reductase iron-sulfur subunit